MNQKLSRSPNPVKVENITCSSSPNPPTTEVIRIPFSNRLTNIESNKKKRPIKRFRAIPFSRIRPTKRSRLNNVLGSDQSTIVAPEILQTCNEDPEDSSTKTSQRDQVFTTTAKTLEELGDEGIKLEEDVQRIRFHECRRTLLANLDKTSNDRMSDTAAAEEEEKREKEKEEAAELRKENQKLREWCSKLAQSEQDLRRTNIGLTDALEDCHVQVARLASKVDALTRMGNEMQDRVTMACKLWAPAELL